MADYVQQRINMVETQLRTCGITQAQLLKAATVVPREQYLTAELRHYAYMDDHIRLDDIHFIMKPSALLKMIQALEISPKDRILDIACTYGYSSHILSYLGDGIIGLEDQAKYVEQATKLTHAQNMIPIKFALGEYITGYPDASPYDAILLQRAYPTCPETLIDQLKPQGRLAYVKQKDSRFGQAVLVTKENMNIRETTIDEFCLPYYHKFDKGFSL